MAVLFSLSQPLAHQQVDVARVEQQEDHTLGTIQLAAAERKGREEEQNGRQQRNQEVEVRDAAHREGLDQRRGAENQEDVGDVRADDVTQRHAHLALEERNDRGCQLRERRATGYERDGNYRL